MREPRSNPSDRREFGKRKVDKKFVLRYLAGYLRPYAPLIALLLLASAASTLLSLAGPRISGMAIDLIRPGGGTDMKKIAIYAGILVALYAVSALLEYLTAIGMAFVSRRAICRIRRDVFERLAALPVGYFDRRQAGDVISVLGYDVDTVGESLASDLVIVWKSSVLVVGSLVMMLTIAAPLVLVFAVTVPLSIVVTRFIVRRVQPLFRRRSAKLGELNGFVEERLTGQRTTRAYCAEDKMIASFEKKNAVAVEAYSRAEYYGTLSGPCVGLVNNISLTLVSVFGALLFMRSIGGVTPGEISSFVLYSRKFSGPINEVANIFGEFQSALAAAERVFRVLEEEPEPADPEGAEELKDVRGEVDIENLRFGYEPNRPVLDGFSLHASPGDLVAIVGHTGAGKTTVINLLMRFYDPDGGCIKIDGKDVRAVTRASLRRAFTMVLQDTWLFAGTVYENLAYGNPSATREEVERVCREAGVHSFISRLPDGYDTELADNAVNLSKGQKQLLTIARAMLLDSPMLILDEATSNVDTRTEQIIQASMRRLMRGRTCFVIAHRLSTIRTADRILVMRDGNVAEQGTHEELLALGGYYAELYAAQFESFSAPAEDSEAAAR